MNSKKVRLLFYGLERKYSRDFIGFVRDSFDFTGLKLDRPTSQQEEIAEALIRYGRVCVSAGGGIGKTAEAAWCVIWALCCHVDSKVLVTGPTGSQLSDVLWSEVRFWIRRCRYGKFLEPKSRWVNVVGYPEWRAVMRVSRDTSSRDVSGAMAGMHARWMFAIVDEGSEVEDAVYGAIDGAMTDPERSFVFVISNPVSKGGYYYDIVTGEPDMDGLVKGYKVLFYDSRESELVDPGYEDAIIQAYGKDSPMYQMKVLGLPVSAGSTSVVVMPGDFDLAVRNRSVPTKIMSSVIGVDPAGHGSDMAVAVELVTGDMVFGGGVSDVVSVVRWVEEKVSGVGDDRFLRSVMSVIGMRQGLPTVPRVVVDGVGSDFGEMLRKECQRAGLRVIVRESYGYDKACDRRRYVNRRTEIMCGLRDNFYKLSFAVKPPDRLKKELANLVVDDGTDGRAAMEPKKRFRKRMRFSPDYADALGLAVDEVFGSSVVRVSQQAKVPKEVAQRIYVPSGGVIGSRLGLGRVNFG